MNNEAVLISGVVVVVWIIFKILRRKPVSIGNNKLQTENKGSEEKSKKWEQFWNENKGIVLGCSNIVFIIFVWLVFISTILYLHPQLFHNRSLHYYL